VGGTGGALGISSHGNANRLLEWEMYVDEVVHVLAVRKRVAEDYSNKWTPVT